MSANGLMADETRVNIGALQQRVAGLDDSQRGIVQQLSLLQSRVESLFTSLSNKIEQQSQPNYALLVSIGVFGLGVIASVGWLAYSPIRDNQAELKVIASDTTKILYGMGKEFVTIREVDARGNRTQTDLARIVLDLKNLNEQNVPRAELVERWRSQEASIVNLQRQMDESKRTFGDTFNLRDALMQMQKRLETVEGKKS